MSPEEIYKLWTRPGATWSGWVKPVLFANMGEDNDLFNTDDLLARVRTLDISWAASADRDTAMIIDLPGMISLEFGLALSFKGYWPVALYNSVPHLNGLVELSHLIRDLRESGELLKTSRPPLDGRPVFLLDKNRMTGSPLPRRFDNRWVTLPQDFPSAGMLLREGIKTVWVVQEFEIQPADDLRHVLKRWQEQGIEICIIRPGPQVKPKTIQINTPSKFRIACYRMLVLLGLRRNSAGGFGALIPEPSSGGGFS